MRTVPYFLDMTEAVAERMKAYSCDPLFLEHCGSCLAMQRNESFTDLAGACCGICLGSSGDKGAQEATSALFGVRHQRAHPQGLCVPDA